LPALRCRTAISHSCVDAALASYEDAEFLKSTREAIIADRKCAHATLDHIGRPHSDAQGNFVFFDTASRSGVATKSTRSLRHCPRHSAPDPRGHGPRTASRAGDETPTA